MPARGCGVLVNCVVHVLWWWWGVCVCVCGGGGGGGGGGHGMFCSMQGFGQLPGNARDSEGAAPLQNTNSHGDISCDHMMHAPLCSM